MTDYRSLLPPNSTKLEKELEKVGQVISDIPVPFVELSRIDDCPDPYLPWLAWENRVEYWNPSWSIEQKRNAIHSAKNFNAGRGSKASLKALIDTVTTQYQLVAWHETTPKGTPYSFVVQVQNELTLDELSQLHTAIDSTKSQRDLYSVQAKVKTIGQITVVGVCHYGETVYMSTNE